MPVPNGAPTPLLPPPSLPLKNTASVDVVDGSRGGVEQTDEVALSGDFGGGWTAVENGSAPPCRDVRNVDRG